MTPTDFASIPLAAPLQRALKELNYETPTPIQAGSIPLLLQGRDLLGCAQTGTGKTASFSLPILHHLHENPRPARPKGARVLVLTPTRELALQVAKSFSTYGKYVRCRHTLVYGGVGQGPQVSAMRQGVDVLVATPGRLLDLIDQRHVDLSGVEFFVLDEVDRMLDMGFLRDVRRIVALLPKKRQSLFFSATLAPDMVALAESITISPARVTVAPETTTAERIEQRLCFVNRGDKKSLLEDLLREQARATSGKLTIVFTRTKHGANRLAKGLSSAGFVAEAIHGNKSQGARTKALDRFKQGLAPVLVATDVAARGVDVKGVGLVVNYDLPVEPEAYVHRIGRTARAGESGMAVSFCCGEELDELRQIERTIRQAIPVWSDHSRHETAVAEQAARRTSQGQAAGNAPRAAAGGGRRRGGSGGGGGGGGGSRSRGGNRRGGRRPAPAAG